MDGTLAVTDFEVEHHYLVSPHQEIVWGAGYRHSDHTSVPGRAWYFDPIDTNLGSIFAQDDLALLPDKLHLIAGTQVQHNTFTGFEIQPTARMLWQPARSYSIWAAVSRAVRTPSVGERGEVDRMLDYDVHLKQVFPLEAHGNPNLQSETLLGYELGQRWQWNRRLSLDWSGFYNFYHRLSTLYTANLYVDPRGFVVMPTVFANQGAARTYGMDASFDLDVTRTWQLSAGYSWLKMVPGSYQHALTLTQIYGPTDPQNQAQVHSNFDLTRSLQLDVSLYYTGSMPAFGIPRHWRGDVRLGWRPSHRVEFSLAGQDLLTPHHAEYLYEVFGRTMQVRRAITGNLSVNF